MPAALIGWLLIGTFLRSDRCGIYMDRAGAARSHIYQGFPTKLNRAHADGRPRLLTQLFATRQILLTLHPAHSDRYFREFPSLTLAACVSPSLHYLPSFQHFFGRLKDEKDSQPATIFHWIRVVLPRMSRSSLDKYISPFQYALSSRPNPILVPSCRLRQRRSQD